MTTVDRVAEQRRFRTALARFATGVTVVTARGPDGEDVGVTANSFNSVSLDPPLVLWSIARTANSIAVFDVAESFAVHVLGAEQRHLSERFARKGADKFGGLDISRGHGGVPLIANTVAVFQCRTAHRYEGGDHVIMVGEVIEFDERDRPPLIYHAGAYGLVVGGVPAAPAASAGGQRLPCLLSAALARILDGVSATGGPTLDDHALLTRAAGGTIDRARTASLVAAGLLDGDQPSDAGQQRIDRMVEAADARGIEAGLTDGERTVLTRVLARLAA